jgi:hypothetical protein
METDFLPAQCFRPESDMKVMRILKTGLHAALLALLLLAATERQAMAYTDPGTGALIWQAMIAAMAGLMFYFRRIRLWWKDRRSKG